MIDAGEVIVKVGAETKGASDGFDAVTGGLEDLQREVKKVSAHLSMLSQVLTQMGEQAAKDAARAADQLTSEIEGLRKESEASASKIEELAKELESVKKQAIAPGIAQAGKDLEDLGVRAQGARGTISAAGRAITAVGGAAGATGGKIATLASTLAGSFAVGGAIGIGLGAAVAGFQLLATEIRESAAEARQLRALNDVLGVTRSEVERVEAAFRAAGNQLDRSVVQSLIATTREAGISTVELAAMADEIKRLQDLSGVDAAGAAAKIAAQRQKDATDDYVSGLKSIADARDQEMSGIPEWEAKLRAGYEADARAIDDLTRKITRLRQDEARTEFGSDESKALRAQMEAAVEERARLRQRQSDAEETFNRLELQDAIDSDEKETLSYVANLNRQRAAADAESRRRAADRKQQADEALRVQGVIASSESSSIHRVRILQAQAAGDRRAEITAQADYEVERAAALMWEHAELADQMRAEIAAIREKQRADIAAIAQKEIDDERQKNEKIAEDARRAADKALADRERDTQMGISAGFSFVGGLKRGIEDGDIGSIIQGLLGGLSGVLSLIPGGGIAGAIAGGIGSLFHEGGMVGTGGRSLPKYHGGGMIKAHRGMMLPQPGPGEVPILAQLGEGVLSRRGIAAAGGPSVVNALNSGTRVQSQPSVTQVYIQAMDPSSAVQAANRTIGPANYRRGISFADSKELAMNRRRLAPRSGRV